MITGFGVAEAVRHFYSIYGGDVKGKKAIVQGFWKCRFSSYL
jgi:glutamate dehydrogenase/leucine dehydrogenase